MTAIPPEVTKLVTKLGASPPPTTARRPTPASRHGCIWARVLRSALISRRTGSGGKPNYVTDRSDYMPQHGS
jgi:hypothetical protein